jgi:hypothetical protein
MSGHPATGEAGRRQSDLLALDIAILLPKAESARAVAASASLPENESQGLRLGVERLPHITLAQLFVRRDHLSDLTDAMIIAVSGSPRLTLTATGATRQGATVWIAIDRTPAIVNLHEICMDVAAPFERDGGSPEAFVDGDARPDDVAWVAGYRRKSAFASFVPHVTLGHAARAPHIEPFVFEVPAVAACQLGRFCTCRIPLAACEWPDSDV